MTTQTLTLAGKPATMTLTSRDEQLNVMFLTANGLVQVPVTKDSLRVEFAGAR